MLAAAALLCRQTEALCRLSALCSHHLPSALPSHSLSSSKGFSFALSRSSEVTPAQMVSLPRCAGGKRGGTAEEDGAGRYGLGTTRSSADSPSSHVLEAEKPPPSSCRSLDQLAAWSVAWRSGSPAHCARNFFFDSTCQNKLPLQRCCINTETATFFFFFLTWH